MACSVVFGRLLAGAATLVVFVQMTAGAGPRADAQSISLKLQIDKPYCILNFMETLRTRGYYGPTLYEH